MTDKELSGKNKFLQALEKQNDLCMKNNPPDEEILEYSKHYQKKIQRVGYSVKRSYPAFALRIAGMIAAFLIVISCSVTVYAQRNPISFSFYI